MLYFLNFILNQGLGLSYVLSRSVLNLIFMPNFTTWFVSLSQINFEKQDCKLISIPRIQLPEFICMHHLIIYTLIQFVNCPQINLLFYYQSVVVKESIFLQILNRSCHPKCLPGWLHGTHHTVSTMTFISQPALFSRTLFYETLSIKT